MKIALLIDADNTPFAKLDDITREISTRGRIILKRAYGNWQKETLKNWNASLKRLAIKAEQQFDYVSGKNATDIALVVDAMSLLNTNIYDMFVISASDSDYTPLAVRLREAGAYVIGIGFNITPKAFRNSCDEYILLDQISSQQTQNIPEDEEMPTEIDEEQEAGDNTEKDIIELLMKAIDQHRDEDGYVQLCTAGAFIRKTIPNFNIKALGYPKLVRFIEEYPEMFELKQNITEKGVIGYQYRLIQN